MGLRDVASLKTPMKTPTTLTRTEQLETELAEMTKQRDEWKEKFIQQNKDLGCELRDPNGTIWDHAKNLERQRDSMQAALTKALDTIVKMTTTESP